jgi:hypothetical protein
MELLEGLMILEVLKVVLKWMTVVQHYLMAN